MDFGKLSYRKKNQYLLWGSLAFVVVVYLLAIQKTLDLWKENTSLKSQLEQASHAPAALRELRQKRATFNSQLGIYMVKESDNQERIVQVANEFCQKNHLILREIPELIRQPENEFEVITTQIVAQGSFSDLLRMVYYFEQINKIGRVTSVTFEKKEDLKTRKPYLAVRILLQNIKLLKK